MTKSIPVNIDLKETSQCIELDALNTYTKGPFYCVYTSDRQVVKFPLDNIWRIVEGYGSSAGNTKGK